MRAHLWIAVLLVAAGCKNGAAREPKATTPVVTDAATDAPARPSAPSASTDAGQSAEACVDAWLEAKGLNEYGDPPDTMYAGGSPLFDERTGTRRERVPYVMQKHPALREVCAQAR